MKLRGTTHVYCNGSQPPPRRFSNGSSENMTPTDERGSNDEWWTRIQSDIFYTWVLILRRSALGAIKNRQCLNLGFPTNTRQRRCKPPPLCMKLSVTLTFDRFFTFVSLHQRGSNVVFYTANWCQKEACPTGRQPAGLFFYKNAFTLASDAALIPAWRRIRGQRKLAERNTRTETVTTGEEPERTIYSVLKINQHHLEGWARLVQMCWILHGHGKMNKDK